MSSNPATDPPAASEAEEIRGHRTQRRRRLPPHQRSPQPWLWQYAPSFRKNSSARSVAWSPSRPLRLRCPWHPQVRKLRRFRLRSFSRHRHGADGADTARCLLACAVAAQAAPKVLGKSANPGSGCSSRGKAQRSSWGAMALASLHSDPQTGGACRQTISGQMRPSHKSSGGLSRSYLTSC